MIKTRLREKMNLHGFKLKDKKFLEEVNGNVYQLEHIKTGANVLFIENDDNNKVFMIGFRTPSNNSTGVAHILEHSTLCGSKKYPVKEPFVELIKGSLNTFLNAMTYPDKTVYPVASTNKKDFRNLTDVYLDAVFNPNIYNNPYTFMQEGWHYHLEDKENPLEYNGVVYNEMKGVFSDPNSVMEKGILESLYPDTIYSQESGGDPNHIPDLTYEEFLNFHKKFYHPSNSYIYVYGDNDLEEQLAYLDSWLSKYEKKEIENEIKTQDKIEKRVEKELNYAINPEDQIENKDMISLNFSFDENLTPLELRSLGILVDYLLDNNASVLKKELLEKNLAGDITPLFESSLKQPFFSIILKDTDISKKDEFIKTVDNILEDLVEKGINKEDLEAVINSNEFRTLEHLNGEGTYYPKGLLIGLNIFDSWLYDKNPVEALKIFDEFNQIKNLSKDNYFETLIKEKLIDNNNQSIVLVQPDKELLVEQQNNLKSKLENIKNNLSSEELDNLVLETEKLIENQNKIDSPEALKTIPRLKIDEIDKEINKIDFEVIDENGYPVVYVENQQGDIVYLTLSFNFLSIKQEDIQYLRILDELLAEVSTENFTYEKLDKEFARYTGGITTSLLINSHLENKTINPLFVIRVACKIENLDKTVELLNEVLNKAFYNEKELIHNIIQALRIQKKTIIQNQGNYIASIRLQAKTSESARLLEEVDGINFYNFLVDLDENFDQYWNQLSEKMIELSNQLFNINNLTVSVACKEDLKEEVLRDVNKLTNTFSKDEIKQNKYKFEELPESEAFLTAGNVQYNAKGGKVKFDENTNYGALSVLKTLLSMDYLWNKVRVLGGAYGVNFSFNRLGDIVMSSFRDPNLDKTFENYDKSVDYIKNLNLEPEEIEKYIIGTISSLDQPLSTKQKLTLATDMFLSGLTNDQRQFERDQILNTNLDDLIQLADIINEILSQNRYVTVGTEQAIDKNNTRFDEIEFVK